MSGFSRRSPAVKRLMKEAEELKEPTEQYYAQPLDDNLFEWHFTVRGPPDSDFHGGVYHGRITLPPEYPMRPPSIMLLTPTGRFEVGTKICLSISGYHPETWQPSWSIRTVLLAIIGFMPTKGEGAIGALDYTPQERKILARKSQDWKCSSCNIPNKDILPKVTSKEQSDGTQREAQELAAQITFKRETKKSGEKDTAKQETASPNQSAQQPQEPVPQNLGPFPPNAFPMFGNQSFPFHPSMFQQLANMNPGQNPFNRMNQQPPFQPSNRQPPTSNSNSSNQVSTPPDPSPSSPSNVSSANENTNTGPRQRRSVRQSSRTSPQSAPSSSSPTSGSSESHVSSDTWAILLIVILSVIIACLALRRLYIMYEYKLDDSTLGE